MWPFIFKIKIIFKFQEKTLKTLDVANNVLYK
jgi:hypothetical protein